MIVQVQTFLREIITQPCSCDNIIEHFSLIFHHFYSRQIVYPCNRFHGSGILRAASKVLGKKSEMLWFIIKSKQAWA